jgi:hypothetical protein
MEASIGYFAALQKKISLRGEAMRELLNKREQP